MNEFLFLYPIKPYIESTYLGYPKPANHPKFMQRFNEMVDLRYRNNGFNVNWLLFPDLSEVDQEVNIHETDKVMVCEVTFAELCKDVYPSPKSILDQLQQPIDRLVVAGFHQWDCVDKVASEAYLMRGISTLVDEDLTEIYFMRCAKGDRIPLVREKPTIDIPEHWPKSFVRTIMMGRLAKPWFTQVSMDPEVCFHKAFSQD